jgi:predicted acyltransferase
VLYKLAEANMNNTTQNKKKRLASLDALRGFDMFWILGGEKLFAALFILTGWTGWQVAHAQTLHSQWHGFTFYDLIFPLFIFLSGVAIALSPKQISHLPIKEKSTIYFKALKRLLILCAFGILYNHGWGTGIPLDFDQVRYASVLSRIAVVWFITVLLVWHTQLLTQVWIAASILVGYWLWLCFIPVPGGLAGDLSVGGAGSWNAWFDSNLLPGTTYQNRAVDPEGILSTLPAIVNGLAGVFTGRFIKQASERGPWKTAILLLIAGVITMAFGWLWDLVFPVNKYLWTSSFTLVTVGWSLVLFALFYAFVDLCNMQRSAYLFVVIGANAVIIYLASSIVDWHYMAKSLFGGVITGLPEAWQPLIGVFALLAVQIFVLHWLYKRKILISV